MRPFVIFLLTFSCGGRSTNPVSVSPSADGGGVGDADSNVDGGGDDAGAGVLDCVWVEGNNCWKADLAAAASCLPPAGEQGSISTDGSTCTYASGNVVTFQPPLPYYLGTSRLSVFEVTTDASPCLSYALSGDGLEVSLTTPAGTVTRVISGTGTSLTIICPNGTTYSALGADAHAALSSCAQELPAIHLDVGGSVSGDGGRNQIMTETVLGTGADGGVLVFDCEN